MLKRLYVDNFKCLVNFEFKPGAFTLLLGDNGSGKSAVMDVVNRLGGLAFGGTCAQCFPFEVKNVWDSRQYVHIEVSLERAGLPDLKYSVQVDYDSVTMLPVIGKERLLEGDREIFLFSGGVLRSVGKGNGTASEFNANTEHSALHLMQDSSNSTGPLGTFKAWLASSHVCRIDPARIAQGYAKDGVRHPGLDHSEFPSWLRVMFTEYPGEIASYFQNLRRVIPGFKELVNRSFNVGSHSLITKLVGQSGAANSASAKDFFLWQLSDGQRKLLSLYALSTFFPVAGGTLLCVDEPDSSVSLAEILPWLRLVIDSATDGEMQVILSSHHPEIMSEAANEFGVYLYRVGNGPTRIREVGDEDWVRERSELGLTVPEYFVQKWDRSNE